MGEYAIRKSDNVEIKIGTCEEMFYLRWEDRNKVRVEHGNLDPASMSGLYFRLPFPDEDSILPGDYDDHCRGLRLYKKGERYCEDYSNPELAESVGTLQLTHKSGLLLNIPCFHGEKLPELMGSKAFWNGKTHSYELTSVKTTEEGLKPIVSCVHCRTAWRLTWTELWDYIPADMQSRFTERGYLITPLS